MNKQLDIATIVATVLTALIIGFVVAGTFCPSIILAGHGIVLLTLLITLFVVMPVVTLAIAFFHSPKSNGRATGVQHGEGSENCLAPHHTISHPKEIITMNMTTTATTTLRRIALYHPSMEECVPALNALSTDIINKETLCLNPTWHWTEEYNIPCGQCSLCRLVAEGLDYAILHATGEMHNHALCYYCRMELLASVSEHLPCAVCRGIYPFTCTCPF